MDGLNIAGYLTSRQYKKSYLIVKRARQLIAVEIAKVRVFILIAPEILRIQGLAIIGLGHVAKAVYGIANPGLFGVVPDRDIFTRNSRSHYFWFEGMSVTT